MAGDSGQKFIRRNRPPRVHITYEDPYNADQKVELPFVMGVLADLSGNASAVEKPDVGERKFLDIDMDNFDQRMAAIEPGVAFAATGTSVPPIKSRWSFSSSAAPLVSLPTDKMTAFAGFIVSAPHDGAAYPTKQRSESATAPLITPPRFLLASASFMVSLA